MRSYQWTGVREELQRSVEAGAEAGTSFVVFANSGYLAPLLNWLIALDRLGLSNALVVSLDAEIHGFLSARGFRTALVPTGKAFRDIQIRRVEVVRELLETGIDLILSDVDAILLRDPRERFFHAQAGSLVASQGTIFPRAAYDRWGFVLCTGFLFLRSHPAIRQLFDTCLELVAEQGDQSALNSALLQHETRWDSRDPDVFLEHRGETVRGWRDVLQGHSESLGLEVSLLPHRLFQRLADPDSRSPYMVHPLSDKNGWLKIPAFRQAACLFLREDWRHVDFDANSLTKLDLARLDRPLASKGRGSKSTGESVQLSVVAAGRNDDYAEGFLHRYQCFLYQLSEQLATYDGNFEILIVEWNPPADEKRLSELVDFVRPSANLTVRFIEVPPDVHHGLPNADRMPFFEYIAKNVGIRRAQGELILATNSDVLLSEELLDHICLADLRDDGFYRADRHDFDGRVSVHHSVVENLRIARESLGHGHVFRPGTGSREEIVAGRPVYGAAGDFFLAHRSVWNHMRGYRELATSGHMDSILCLEALGEGFEQYVLPSRMKVFHQAHGMFRQFRPQTHFQKWRDLCEEDDRRPDRHGWGLSHLELPELVLNVPRWQKPVVSFQGVEG